MARGMRQEAARQRGCAAAPRHAGIPLLLALILVLVCAPGTPGIAQTEHSDAQGDREILARLDSLVRRARGTPAQEEANRRSHPPYKKAFEILRSPQTTGERQRHTAVGMCDAFLNRLEAQLDWPVPSPLRVPRCRTRPVLDGVLENEVWQGTVTCDGVYALNSRHPRRSPRTEWRLLWDDEFLYIGVNCADTRIEAKAEPRDADIYFGDVVQVFISAPKHGSTYWDIAVNPEGSLWDARHVKHPDAWGMEPGGVDHDLPELRAATRKTFSTPPKGSDADPKLTGYGVELAIPLAPLAELAGGTGRARNSGLRIMLLRQDHRDGGLTTYAYQPLIASGHNIWNHARLVLVPGTPAAPAAAQ